jgi:type IV secretory pathway VirB10-like protein
VERVSVSKGLLIGVVAIAAVSALALVFQLGRASGPGVPTPPARIERVAPRPQEEPPPQPAPAAAEITEHAETRPASGPAPSAPAQRAEPQAAAGPAAAPAGEERSSAGPDPVRASVAAYFDTVDHIQPEAMSGEAEGVANQMAAALANGDTSGLDKMIRETEAAKERLAAVTPPAPCAVHYRESVGSLDDALDVLRSLKSAMESPEPAAQLASVATRATALRSRADVLEKEELALRQRYGLKH